MTVVIVSGTGICLKGDWTDRYTVLKKLAPFGAHPGRMGYENRQDTDSLLSLPQVTSQDLCHWQESVLGCSESHIHWAISDAYKWEALFFGNFVDFFPPKATNVKRFCFSFASDEKSWYVFSGKYPNMQSSEEDSYVALGTLCKTSGPQFSHLSSEGVGWLTHFLP